MSKGIVKRTPPVTRRGVTGKLLVEEVDGIGNQRYLNTEIDFLSSIPVFLGDYVEFTLNLNGISTVTKKIYSRGIVKELNSVTGEGKLEVMVVNPNTLGVVPHSYLSFYNNASIPLAVNDYVEFINMTAMRCTVFRNIVCVGSIQLLPVRSIPGSILVSKVEINPAGVRMGYRISFPLPAPTPSPFRQYDTIEFTVVGPLAGRYVQLLSPE